MVYNFTPMWVCKRNSYWLKCKRNSYWLNEGGRVVKAHACTWGGALTLIHTRVSEIVLCFNLISVLDLVLRCGWLFTQSPAFTLTLWSARLWS